jgi:hypothetical protein
MRGIKRLIFPPETALSRPPEDPKARTLRFDKRTWHVTEIVKVILRSHGERRPTPVEKRKYHAGCSCEPLQWRMCHVEEGA